MKALVYAGPHRVECREVAEPRVAHPRDAVVAVTLSAICGTDLHPYRGELPDFAPGTVLGHEFVGVVVDAGPEVPFTPGTRVLASDLVACGRCPMCERGWHYQCPEVTLFGYDRVVGRPLGGGQAEQVLVPNADVVLSALPDDMDDEHALFAGDILTTGLAAAEAAGLTPGATVAVVGCGAVGLLAAQAAALLGAGAVVASDGDDRRRAQARSLGIDAVGPDDLDAAVRDRTAGRGADACIEAVGTDQALLAAVEVAGPRAVVVAVGAHHSPATPFPSGTAFARELTLRFVVGNPLRSRHQALALVRAGRIDPTTVISDRMPLTDGPAGYELFDAREATKVVLRPDAT